MHELPDDWGGQFAEFFTGKYRNFAIDGEHIYFLSNDTKLHAIHYKTGTAKFVQQYMHSPKAFDKSDDSNGCFGTGVPLAIPGPDRRSPQRHRHGRLARRQPRLQWRWPVDRRKLGAGPAHVLHGHGECPPAQRRAAR